METEAKRERECIKVQHNNAGSLLNKQTEVYMYIEKEI